MSDDLEDRVQQLERDLQAVAQHVPDSRSSDDRGRAVQDAMWKCRKCNALLAFYDPETDVLRMRYKDHVTFARVGGADATEILELVSDWLSKERDIEVGDLGDLVPLVEDRVDLGFVQVICRGCSEINTSPYATHTEVQQAREDATPVVRRRRAG